MSRKIRCTQGLLISLFLITSAFAYYGEEDLKKDLYEDSTIFDYGDKTLKNFTINDELDYLRKKIAEQETELACLQELSRTMIVNKALDIEEAKQQKNEIDEYRENYNYGWHNAHIDWNRDKVYRFPNGMQKCSELGGGDFKCVEATYNQLSGYQCGYSNAWEKLKKENKNEESNIAKDASQAETKN